MDDRMRGVKQTFTRDQLKNMTAEQLVALVGEAGPNAKFKGKGVIKRADGSIKYDKLSVPGEYGETATELADHAIRDAKLPDQANVPE